MTDFEPDQVAANRALLALLDLARPFAGRRMALEALRLLPADRLDHVNPGTAIQLARRIRGHDGPRFDDSVAEAEGLRADATRPDPAAIAAILGRVLPGRRRQAASLLTRFLPDSVLAELPAASRLTLIRAVRGDGFLARANQALTGRHAPAPEGADVALARLFQASAPELEVADMASRVGRAMQASGHNYFLTKHWDGTSAAERLEGLKFLSARQCRLMGIDAPADLRLAPMTAAAAWSDEDDTLLLNQDLAGDGANLAQLLGAMAAIHAGRALSAQADGDVSGKYKWSAERAGLWRAALATELPAGQEHPAARAVDHVQRVVTRLSRRYVADRTFNPPAP